MKIKSSLRASCERFRRAFKTLSAWESICDALIMKKAKVSVIFKIFSLNMKTKLLLKDFNMLLATGMILKF